MTVISTGTSIFADAPAHRVYYRARWSDSWTQQPYLYCDELDFVAAPAISSATLRWVYGEGMPAGATGFAQFTPLTPEGFYIRIEVDEDGVPGSASLVWHGRVVETPEERRGAYADALGNRVLSGVQTLRCLGLEYELAREPIGVSAVATASGGEQGIRRALAFNADDRGAARANMSPTVSSFGTRVFAADLKTAQAWNAREILDYLLTFHAPRDAQGQVSLPFRLDTTVSLAHLAAHRPTLSVAGRTLKDLLDELVGRDRMSGYTVGVNGQQIFIKSFTFNDAAINLPDGSFIPANPNTKSFDFDQAFDITLAAFSTSIQNQFEQVIVRGARRGSVMTVSTLRGDLEPDWTAAQQDEYDDPTPNIPGYAGGLTEEEKKLHVAAYRQRDMLAPVYRRFRLRENWDGKVVDAFAGGPAQNVVFPTIDESTGQANINTPGNFWRPGLRFERFLPLRAGHDYTGANIANNQVTDQNPPGTIAEFLPPIVLFKDQDQADRYLYVEKLSARPDAGGIDFSCDVRVADEGAALWLDVSGGEQHQLAKGVWTQIDQFDDADPRLDYRDDIVATVYVESDEHVEVRWPVDSAVNAGLSPDHPRRLVIDLPDAHLDYVAQNTIVDVKDGALVRATVAGFLPDRDDRGRLAAVARLAFEWYAVQRKALSLSYRQIKRVADVGDMVTQIGAAGTQEAIRTVVTRVHYHLARGETSIQTEHVELAAPLLALPAGPRGSAGGGPPKGQRFEFRGGAP